MPRSAPLISVIIATYHRASSLDRCLRSVLAEPGDDIEVLVGDDASPDDTPAVIAAHQHDPRLRHYRNEHNLGMQVNYLKIAHQARGDYLFIVTDDDWVLPGALTTARRRITAHPEAGYFISHLPTVDDRTGRIVHWHRPLKADTLLQPGLATTTQLAGSAWVLSRQIFKRATIDWETWQKHSANIYFPVIVAGRAMLTAPTVYIAGALVMHTWFNTVHWSKFGRNELEIEYNLAVDGHRCMRAILHDYPATSEVREAIRQWERASFRSYVFNPHRGLYDLIKSLGVRAAWQKVITGFEPDRRQCAELLAFAAAWPGWRAWIHLKAGLRRLVTTGR